MKKIISALFLFVSAGYIQAQTTTSDGSSNGGSSGTSGSTHGSTNNTNGAGSKESTNGTSNNNVNTTSGELSPPNSNPPGDTRDNMNTSTPGNKNGNTFTVDGSGMQHRQSGSTSHRKKNHHPKNTASKVKTTKNSAGTTSPQ